MGKGIKKTLLISCFLISVVILIWYFDIHNYFTLTVLRENKAYLQAIVQESYFKAVFIFISVYTAVVAVLIPGVPPLTIMGGFLFGFIPGVVYSGIGAAGGATLSFLLIRYVLGNMIKGKYAKKLQRFNEKIESQGAAYYLLTMQLVGIIPYFIINTLAALAHVSSFTFFWTTLVGSLPTLCVYTFAGKQLHSIESVKDIFSPSIIVALALLALLSIIPLLVKLFRKERDSE